MLRDDDQILVLAGLISTRLEYTHFYFSVLLKVITRLAGMEEVTASNTTFSLEQEITLILLVPL